MRFGLGAEVVLVEAFGQVELVIDLVNRVAGLAAQRAENIGMGAVLRLLARCVIEHDVVWVDQADDHEPRLAARFVAADRSEEHTSELQSLMRISYAVFCLKKKTTPP